MRLAVLAAALAVVERLVGAAVMTDRALGIRYAPSRHHALQYEAPRDGYKQTSLIASAGYGRDYCR